MQDDASVPVSHTINNLCPQITGSESKWWLAGFEVLCGANIVGNIISAEKRCNYPGRSRVTRLVYDIIYIIMSKMQITHLLARKVAACLSTVTVGRTVGALVDAVAAGNWVNGNPSLSLSVDDL